MYVQKDTKVNEARAAVNPSNDRQRIKQIWQSKLMVFKTVKLNLEILAALRRCSSQRLLPAFIRLVENK